MRICRLHGSNGADVNKSESVSSARRAAHNRWQIVPIIHVEHKSPNQRCITVSEYSWCYRYLVTFGLQPTNVDGVGRSPPPPTDSHAVAAARLVCPSVTAVVLLHVRGGRLRRLRRRPGAPKMLSATRRHGYRWRAARQRGAIQLSPAPAPHPA